MATRAEIHEKYGVARLMPPNVANEQLSAEDAAMYERMIQMHRQAFDEFENDSSDDLD